MLCVGINFRKKPCGLSHVSQDFLMTLGASLRSLPWHLRLHHLGLSGLFGMLPLSLVPYSVLLIMSQCPMPGVSLGINARFSRFHFSSHPLSISRYSCMIPWAVPLVGLDWSFSILFYPCYIRLRHKLLVLYVLYGTIICVNSLQIYIHVDSVIDCSSN